MSVRWLLVLVLAATGSTRADERSFRFTKEIETEARKQEEIVAVALDSDVYAGTRDRFPDLRVFDSEGNEVPYLLERATETRTQKTRRFWAAKNLSLRETEGGGLEIQARLEKDDSSPDGIRLVTPLKDFQHRVRVFGSANGQDWKPLGEEALVFDYTRYMDVNNSELTLPPNEFRQFRVVIDDVTSAQESQLLELTRRLQGGKESERLEKVTIQRRPFRIDRLEFWRTSAQEQVKGEKKGDYPPAEFAVEQDSKNHTTLITIRTRREPLTRFTLETPKRNFSRRASIEVPEQRGVQTEWRKLAEGTISSIDFRDLKREHLSIDFPEHRGEQYRIVVHNADNPPLDITKMAAQGDVYRVVFLSAPEKTYRLLYGSEEAVAPNYETVAVVQAMQKGYRPLAAGLGEQSALGGSAPAWRPGSLLENRLLIGGVIGLLVVVLGWALFRASRRIEESPKG